ncbi:MAG: Hpt domain-containing protein [Pirellulales bacterium]|jgi:histidine phosphotransfer protein HptB
MSPSVPVTEPLYSTLGGDPDLAEIVTMFVDEMPERIENLETRFKTHDFENLQRAAHQLKGAAGSYGFNEVTPYAARLETAVREHEPEDRIQDALDALVDLCRRARAGTPT